MPKIIVSITPVALDRDSRTLKIAHSFAKWRYQSIVVEGQKSALDFSKYGIKVLSLADSSEKIPNNNVIYSKNFVVHFLKAVWFQLKKMRLTFFLNYLSFYDFKRRYYNKYTIGIDKNIPDADIYYLHSYEYFFAVKKKIKKNRAKLVYDAHDFYTKINPDKPFLGSNLIKDFQKKIEKSLIRTADLMFTVSEGLKKLYMDEYNTSSIVIRNAHSSDIDLPSKTTIKAYFGLKQSDIITVIIGNQKEGQALNQIIKAFLGCASKNNYLVFIGGGYHTLKESLPLKNQERILFLSRLQPTDIVSIASEANFAILPYFALTNNYRYALPNGFFQMTAAQLPILFSKDLEEINALNKIEHFGLATNFNDPNQLKKDLNNLLENFSKKDALSAKQNLTWENEEIILRKEIQKLTECK